MGQLRYLFCLFSSLSNRNVTHKTVGVIGIQTQIVGEKGKHDDHLTTTTAHEVLFPFSNWKHTTWSFQNGIFNWKLQA